ncbi:thioesterase family protein [Pelagicoccus sp. SDUM812003]|uniref:acyl-CoA thioesterase n=1 Tax=Pelagicoccus sp. SDUM812003 TaxID=3041267 RepID=UPI00280C63D9|nr:thioesterase family protein [Pelagicoccus sp. SDUM812003]MDQ8205558.1 thioesterase family protein [Pelagicoccus sp. SDUM812003]
MIESVSEIQVRYAETDMMGIVYHANYLPWLEIGRTNLLRENGLPYKELEQRGFLLPVLEVNLKYKQPARYDDLVTIRTRMAEKPFLRIRLDYELSRGETLLASGYTVHAFMNKDGQPVKVPAFFRDAMADAFAEKS